MRVLVTGGTGFVGKHMVVALHGDGHEVIVPCRHPEVEISSGAESAGFVRCDVCDAQEAESVIRKSQPEMVFHMAAQLPRGGVPESLVRANVSGTMNVAMACAKIGVKRLIVSSTMAVFIKNGTWREINEGSEFGDGDYYALSKLMGEMSVRLVAGMEDLPVVVLRYPGIYGPGVKETFFKYLFECAVAGKKACVRHSRMVTDYITVSDVVKANMLAMEYGISGNYEAFNIGGGITCQRDVLAGIAAKICGGIDMEYDGLPEGRAGMIADGTKAEKVLGYTPSCVEAAISGYWNWFKRGDRYE